MSTQAAKMFMHSMIFFTYELLSNYLVKGQPLCLASNTDYI